MGKLKFEIELEDVYVRDSKDGKDVPERLYRVKGFNSLVFDEQGLKKLKRSSSEEDYRKGFLDGKEVGIEEGRKQAIKEVMELLSAGTEKKESEVKKEPVKEEKLSEEKRDALANGFENSFNELLFGDKECPEGIPWLFRR